MVLMVPGCVVDLSAYSVLTHEELIDLAWNDSIRPVLLARFPGASDAELKEAHAYAYGGSAIQDMGYYPFGKEFFSDLTHYVRTGDFVAWMLRNARTIDEYAFAIGALSHYLGDSLGHSEAVNPATAVEFPKLRDKFGRIVTYDESPHGHIRTEFAFDVGELTNAEFAPIAYMRFIGFKVPRKFLERAFLSIYGFKMHDLGGRHADLRSYRTSVRTLIPAFAEAEVVLHRNQFPAPPKDEAYRIFSERVAQTNYDRHWKRAYHGPGFGAHLLAGLVFILPKIGPISDLAIKIPNHETEEWYLSSVNRTEDRFRELLTEINDEPRMRIALTNIDLDTGDHVARGTYALTDKTYAHLLKRLTAKPEREIPAGVQRNIEEYYSGGKTEAVPAEVKVRLGKLQKMRAVEEPK